VPRVPNNWNYCVEDGRLRVQGRNESVTCDANNDGVSENPVCAPNYGNGRGNGALGRVWEGDAVTLAR
jgi:hypothetical protein